MKSFSQGNTAFRYLKVPTQSGALVKRATGTSDPVTADLIGDMVEWLAKRHAWTILERVTGSAGTPKATLSLEMLYGHWVATPTRPNPRTAKPMAPSDDERVEHVMNALNDVLLDPLVTEFDKALRSGSRKIGVRSADTYFHHVRTLIPEGSLLTAATLTTPSLTEWLERPTALSSGTLRVRGSAVRQFCRWLKAKGVLAYNPMDGVKLAKAGAPLCHYVDAHEAEELAKAQHGQHRLYSAVLAGTGIETTVARALRRRDVDVDAKTIAAAGTKNYNRRRVARVATWAWPYILEAVEGKLPDALLFDQVTRRSAECQHIAAVRALIVRGFGAFARANGKAKRYTQRDQRHTWAVYAVRGGWPLHAVSKQLGHANGVLAMTTYGTFVPSDEERDRWEARAASAATTRAKSLEVIPIRKGA